MMQYILYLSLLLTPYFTTLGLDETVKEYVIPKPEGNTIGKITIDDRSSGITQATWIYVKNALEYYKKSRPLFLILELNTPGGEVFSAQKISDALKDLDTQEEIPVVAYINNWAISAGAMLAYSSRYIAVVKDASMGAAEPVLQDAATGEMKTASEKINSALRADFANRARFFGRNPDIAEAMVDKDLILVMRGGKIMKLENDAQIKPDDVVISPKGKLLTLNARELVDYGVADISLEPVKLSPIGSDEQKAGRWPASKEALFQYPYFAAIPDAVIDEYQMDWKTRFFVFLAHPIVSSILMLGLMLGAYMEFNHPGLTLPGFVAISSLFLLTLSSFSLEIADWLELILLLSGLILILVELFILPSFGFVGFIGFALFFIGLAGIVLPGMKDVQFEWDTKTFNAAGEVFLQHLGWFLATLLLGLFCIFFFARYMAPKMAPLQKFILKGNEQVGYFAGLTDLPKAGALGITDSPLRPAGKISIEGKLYDAMSTGQFIEAGKHIIVVGQEGSQLIVRESRL